MLPTAHGTWKVLRTVWQHPSNRRRRVRRLLLTARFQLAGRLLATSIVVPYGNRMRLRCVLDEASSRRAVYCVVPDWPEMLVWREHLQPGSLFVDVGANVGLYTLWAADCGASVVAVEPDSRTVLQLRENVRLSGCAAEVHEAVLADREGPAFLAGGDPNRRALARATDAGAVEVAALTLDGLVGDRFVDGMKIDVEGAERLVLEGGRRLFSEQRVGLVQIEWNRQSQRLFGEDRQPLARLLARHGYELLRPDHTGALRTPAGTGFGRDVFARPAERGGGTAREGAG